MGYDTDRFVSEPDDEFICSICSGVLQNPVMTLGCEHFFCSSCIYNWLVQRPLCPLDRTPISHRTDLRPAPRPIKNLISRLEIHCDYAADGCSAITSLEALDKHRIECNFNPQKPIPCSMGCEKTLSREDMASHNCFRELKMELSIRNKQLARTIHQRNIAILLFTLLAFFVIMTILYGNSSSGDIIFDWLLKT